MRTPTLLILGLLPLLGPQAPADHSNNTTFTTIVRDGIELGGTLVRLPAPVGVDGQDENAQHDALLRVAGSEQARTDLLRESVTAPYILKVHDTRAAGGIVRLLDLWFVVRADLEELNPLELSSQASGRKVGAGNMEFQHRLLTAGELRPRGKTPLDGRTLSRWYAHVDGSLLDRIEVLATTEVVATRTAESLVIASRTDREFDPDGPFANRWKPLRPGGGERQQPYAGGISYAKLARLKHPQGALLVELHAAFLEPDAWFQGAPILRSKFAPIAQDQIRRLRRELRKAPSNSTGRR